MYVGGRESLGRTEDLSEIGSNYLDAMLFAAAVVFWFNFQGW